MPVVTNKRSSASPPKAQELFQHMGNQFFVKEIHWQDLFVKQTHHDTWPPKACLHIYGHSIRGSFPPVIFCVHDYLASPIEPLEIIIWISPNFFCRSINIKHLRGFCIPTYPIGVGNSRNFQTQIPIFIQHIQD